MARMVGGEGNPATAVRDLAFLALPLCLHAGERGVSPFLQGQLDAFNERIMDFAPLVEGDLPQRLISGLWQIDARMLDVGSRPPASGLRWGASSARRGSGGAFPLDALLRPL
jgi:hypothetical protein